MSKRMNLSDRVLRRLREKREYVLQEHAAFMERKLAVRNHLCPSCGGDLKNVTSWWEQIIAPTPPLPTLPKSVLINLGGVHSLRWPPHRVYMIPQDGVDCPCYEPRKVKT